MENVLESHGKVLVLGLKCVRYKYCDLCSCSVGVCHLGNSNSFARWHHFDATISTLALPLVFSYQLM